jgi:hypothetical protein
VAKLVARLLATGSSLGSNLDIYQKYNMGDISNGVTNKLQPAKKNKKKFK